jgi:hypothetical protein
MTYKKKVQYKGDSKVEKAKAFLDGVTFVLSRLSDAAFIARNQGNHLVADHYNYLYREIKDEANREVLKRK